MKRDSPVAVILEIIISLFPATNRSLACVCAFSTHRTIESLHCISAMRLWCLLIQTLNNCIMSFRSIRTAVATTAAVTRYENSWNQNSVGFAVACQKMLQNIFRSHHQLHAQPNHIEMRTLCVHKTRSDAGRCSCQLPLRCQTPLSKINIRICELFWPNAFTHKIRNFISWIKV